MTSDFISSFLQSLSAYEGTLTFNPWRDSDPAYEVPDAVSIRTGQLSDYLSRRLGKAKYLLIAEACRQAGPPLVIDEGLALQAEPPARRLMYRLLLPTTPTDPTVLLSNTTVPVDTERFYAEAGVLAAWLLDALDARRNADDPPLVSLLLRSAAQAQNPDWWRSFGFDSAAAAGAAWQAWSAAQRDPPRMPLMIRAEPPADRRRQPE